MTWLNWNDFLAPSNPYAALLFGAIVTIVIAISMWADTKKSRTFIIAVVAGFVTTIVGVGLLTMMGFYQGG